MRSYTAVVRSSTWDDVTDDPQGVVITLSRSKTDQEGKGPDVPLHHHQGDVCRKAFLRALPSPTGHSHSTRSWSPARQARRSVLSVWSTTAGSTRWKTSSLPSRARRSRSTPSRPPSHLTLIYERSTHLLVRHRRPWKIRCQRWNRGLDTPSLDGIDPYRVGSCCRWLR